MSIVDNLNDIVAALLKVDASFGEQVLPALQAFQISSIKEIWELLSTQIDTIPSAFVRVIDDYRRSATSLVEAASSSRTG